MENLLTGLRSIKEEYKDTPIGTSGLSVGRMAKECADAIEKLLQVYKWIPLTEQLPESHKDVLLTDGASIRVGWLSNDKMVWFPVTSRLETNFTHWAMLPKLPERR